MQYRKRSAKLHTLRGAKEQFYRKQLRIAYVYCNVPTRFRMNTVVIYRHISVSSPKVQKYQRLRYYFTYRNNIKQFLYCHLLYTDPDHYWKNSFASMSSSRALTKDSIVLGEQTYQVVQMEVEIMKNFLAVAILDFSCKLLTVLKYNLLKSCCLHLNLDIYED